MKTLIKKAVNRILMPFDAQVTRIGQSGREKEDQRNRDLALAALTGLERSGCTLSKSMRKLADEYAVDVLGSQIHAPWLYVYAAASGVFSEGWIPNSYYGRYVVPLRKGAYGNLSDRKAFAKLLFSRLEIPDLAYSINGKISDSEWKFVAKQDIERLFFSLHDVIVFKLEGSSQGKGVLFLKRNGFSYDSLYKFPNGVFQAPIKQHPFFDQFTTGSVSTIRMTTVVKGNDMPSLRACYLRLARSGETHVASASNVRVPVDTLTGELQGQAHLSDWSRVQSHPDGGAAFGGGIVPEFFAAKTAVLQAHADYPFCEVIGWDIAINEEGRVMVMEWNGGHNDIKFSEATQGPCFADMGWESLWKE